MTCQTVPEVIARATADLQKLNVLLDQFPRPSEPIVDQFQAAAHETEINYERLREHLKSWSAGDFVSTDRDTHTLALCVFSAAMAQRGVKPACVHAKDPTLAWTSPRPMFVSLDARFVACNPCIRSGKAVLKQPADDGRCDFCQQSTTIFTEFLQTLAPITMHGNFCTTCADALVALLSDQALK